MSPSVIRIAVEANTCQLHNFVSMLNQRRILLTGIEPAMGCDAGPTLNRNWVGLHCVYEIIYVYNDLSINVTVRSGVKKTHGSTFHWQVLHGCWPIPAMVVEGIGLHAEDILIIKSWTFRIMAHEENQYSYVYEILDRFFV